MESKRIVANLLFIVFLFSFSRVAAQGDYLDFLYRYMPLPDRADYPRSFFERQVQLALEARQQMPWGLSVPEREFRHFVLPVRVNNEDLDSCREVFFHALKERVKGMTMQQAILEVNHWCHEHVTYRPTDARSSSPLATMRTAFGRCGEESIFLVAALRSVDIPARQVYTPRWAHTDDNHAWVEAWADGKWFFLGACEPEPMLNLAWFTQSASRGMLMHTRVFGDYDGPEEVMSRTPCFTEINVTANYAPTSMVSVRVVDQQGQPVAGACVDFRIYNYAEFYPVATKITDADGRVSLSAGRGDMLLWVSKDGKTAISKVTFDEDKEVQLLLSDLQLPLSMDLDMVPPPVSATIPQVTSQQRAENNRRLAMEDSIRQAYEQTMPVEKWRGNHATIQRFLDETADKGLAQRLLSVLSEKDLWDVTLDVLRDNVQAFSSLPSRSDSQLFDRYVLCPRVGNELLTPYKHFLRSRMSAISSPEQLEKWCLDSIRLDNEHNPQRLSMRPMSVYRERMADELGRNIFFVSAARSMGFPARINEVSGAVEYLRDSLWVRAFAPNASAAQPLKATVHIAYKPVEHYENPKYYIHFTLSRMVDGRPQLLTYPEEATWQSHFAQDIQLEWGDYLLTTGTRLASGRVKARIDPFRVQSDARTGFTMREDPSEPQVIGLLNAENRYYDHRTKKEKSLLSTTGRGYYVLGILAPNQEPTSHALRDISACRSQLEQWGRKLMLLFPNEEDAARFRPDEFPNLPSTVEWGTDVDGTILREAINEMKLTDDMLPIFIICDTFNRVVFVSQGYTIHLGEQLMKVIRKL